MKLQDFLKKSSLSVVALSRMCNITRCGLQYYLRGRVPTLLIALKIQKVTNNKVKVEDFLDDKARQQLAEVSSYLAALENCEEDAKNNTK